MVGGAVLDEHVVDDRCLASQKQHFHDCVVADKIGDLGEMGDPIKDVQVAARIDGHVKQLGLEREA